MRTKVHKSSTLDIYFNRLSKYPVLTKEEQDELCYKVEFENDAKAKHKLLCSNLRLVIFIVKKEFKSYNIPFEDLIQEGNMGLMPAIENYKSSVGTKFSTYIGLCIKWKIYTYILKNFKQVNIGRTTMQVKLFFKMRKLKATINLPQKEEREYIADAIGVNIEEIEKMEMAMYGRYYSYDTVYADDDEGDDDFAYNLTPSKYLHKEKDDPSYIVEKEEYQSYIIDALVSRLNKMEERERHIILNRHFVDQPVSLAELGKYYKLTKERIRQIEKPAFEILKQFAKDLVKET